MYTKYLNKNIPVKTNYEYVCLITDKMLSTSSLKVILTNMTPYLSPISFPLLVHHTLTESFTKKNGKRFHASRLLKLKQNKLPTSNNFNCLGQCILIILNRNDSSINTCSQTIIV